MEIRRSSTQVEFFAAETYPLSITLPTVLIVGNSISEKSDIGLSYPKMIAKYFENKINILEVVKGGYSVIDLESIVLDFMYQHRPNVLILQIGHVDCGPRPLYKHERNFLSKIKPEYIKNLVIKFIHNNRARIIRFRGVIQFVSPPEFRESVGRITLVASSINCQVIILPITRVTKEKEIREPWYNQEIDRYNAILQTFASKNVSFIDQENLLPGKDPLDYCILPDDIHLNGQSHAQIADYLVSLIENFLLKNAKTSLTVSKKHNQNQKG